MKNSTLFFGYTISDAAKLSGLPWPTVYRHAHGQRKISAECAIIYHKRLGIPLKELRPDLWEE